MLLNLFDTYWLGFSVEIISLVRSNKKVTVGDGVEHWQASCFAYGVGERPELGALEQEDFASRELSEGFLGFGDNPGSD